MAKRNNHLFTLAVLFIAVLLAYRQRNKNPPYTPPSTTDNIYYPSPTTATTASTMTHLPHPHISEARQLPKQVFALLSRIPSPLPLIWALIIWIYHLILSISTPIRIVFDALSVIFAPIILLLSATYHYLVAIPTGIALSIGRTLYPLYVFAATAILFGALVGACGGMLHGGIVKPWSNAKTREADEAIDTAFAHPHRPDQRRQGDAYADDGFVRVKQEDVDDIQRWRQQAW
ncbi:hypothetical protein PIIN_07988 [Serendipita indica DSM 11827]|uniref:Golgi apparatus membrane protein TVP38 n=1 Tax=Serendipita indica (strain DSM 11827) TaxID=1109443 RepID=G4TRU1_SERID|nr:hypothetical protein PIIN_07988 [Serendipita indica DSM 11827]